MSYAEPLRQVVAVVGRGLTKPGELIASADDLGLTRGDGVFDAMRVLPGEGGWYAENLELHLARFVRSAIAAELPEPDSDAWRAAITEALAACEVPGQGVLKLVLTRGDDHASQRLPLGFCTISALVAGGRRPLDVTTLSIGRPSDAFADAPWLLGGVKTLSYALAMSGKREATRRGCDDALWVSTDGYALEATTAALVWVDGGVVCSTPSGDTGILESVTLTTILDGMAEAGIPTDRRLVRPGDLDSITGAWLASSARGVCPIATLDARILPTDDDWTDRIASAAGF
jgi:4-amino-4-deoxychorismate lyase